MDHLSITCYQTFHTQISCYSFLLKLTLLLLLLTNANPLSFNFTTFKPNTLNITFQGDAFQSSGVLQLTKNQAVGSLASSVGRASYSSPIRLWDSATGHVTDFTTHFSFMMQAFASYENGDGISFFLAPFDSDIPDNSTGGFLGLFSPETAFNASQNQVIAVEFDSFKNDWDFSFDHVGINVNSIVSVKNVTWKSSLKNGSVANAWVSYNSTTKNLSVFLTYADKPVYEGQSILSYNIDLREFLPEEVRIGFSASTGSYIEIHSVLSWSFNSSLDVSDGGKGKGSFRLWFGFVGCGVLGCLLGLAWFFFWRKKAQKVEAHKKSGYDASIDNEFEKGTGPKRFIYKELSEATNDFAEEGKLGEGGFGGVYKGLLSESNREIAVKRISRGSKQGKKEYIAEVKIISRLRHRNLVQLIGWCHDQGDLILVYEYLPNGSLNSHLFGKKQVIKWPIRYKIALGLASALLYLHEEWEQCVVHRDIKSSNVMLDSSFNVKLGDFGLARLFNHDELGSQTTVLAGTMGYLAPECVIIGTANKKTDVYSFGVVALEISCGRRPVNHKAKLSEIRLVEWVWDLYGKGQTLEAVDKRLNMEFDEFQIECLMVVGLWCCHPDPTIRPSIRQVINVLNFEAPLPRLPAKLPVPMYFAPPMDICMFSYASPGQTNKSTLRDQTQCSISSYTKMSTFSSKTLLNSCRS